MTDDHLTGAIGALIGGALTHGQNSEPGHQVGDLEDLLHACWTVMSTDQREKVLMSDAARNPLRELGWVEATLLAEDTDTGERSLIATDRVPPDDVEKRMIDLYWDNRLDSVDVVPVVLTEEIE